MPLTEFFIQSLHGLTLGALFALVAIGYTMVFGIIKLINFAHGEFYMTGGFAGMLSLLYAGKRLVAGHFGMRGRFAWHYWFPAYDPEMAKYSPGLILLLKMAEHAPSLGVRTIDLGLGMSLYKQRLMNASVPLAGGSVELSPWRSLKGYGRRTLRSLWVNLPLGSSVRDKINALRPKRCSEQRGR